MAMIDSLVGKLVRKGQLTVVFANGSERSFGPGGEPSLRVRMADRRVAFDIARNPRVGVGEAFMDSRIVVENGDILDLLRLVVGANRWEDQDSGRRALNKGKRRWPSLFRRNDAKSSRRNVAHHYDVGNDLYRLFLDSDLQYSCAYFTDPSNSLEQAQSDKKAHIAAKLYLKPKQTVLDIGCGWGGTALYLNRVADVDVLGVTLSEEQLKVARQRAHDAGVSDRVKFELIDYRSLTGKFDRIVSIGMFEHVGAAHFDEFFLTCRDLLADDGVMLLHTIGKYGKASTPDPFTDKYIFPGYHLPSISQLAASTERARLITSDLEILRLHYAYTLQHWYDRAVAARAKIVELHDDRFYRMWIFYLAGGIVAFEGGSMCNYQAQYVRDRTALPITRDYMIEAERRYRKLDEAARPAAKAKARTTAKRAPMKRAGARP